jgi:hypothetical protein
LKPPTQNVFFFFDSNTKNRIAEAGIGGLPHLSLGKANTLIDGLLARRVELLQLGTNKSSE